MFRVRKSVIAIGTLLCLIALLFLYSSDRTVSFSPEIRFPYDHVEATPAAAGKTKQVEAAFQHAWNGYSKHCFGHDSLHPVSNKCDDDFSGLGATAIDSLTTAILMNNEPVVLQILRYIATVDWTKLSHQHTKIQSFEVIIRHFAAMISAYDLLHAGGPFEHLAPDATLRARLYDQMVRLGDILACSFNTGPLGIPRGWVDPKTCTTDEATTNSLAGVGTMVLEFARLSDITGDRSYVELAKRAEAHLLNATVSNAGHRSSGGSGAAHDAPVLPFPGLLGSTVAIGNAHLDTVGSWGAPSDSFYEYLIKAYLYDRDAYAAYLPAWLQAADSTVRHIASRPYGYQNWTLLSTWHGKTLTYRMDSLSWFAGGNFLLAGMATGNATLVAFGLGLADTAGAIASMTATGLGPEFVDWTPECEADGSANCDPAASVRFSDTSFKLRPEVLETWYYAWRATRDPKYRAWSWRAFEAILRVCKTPSGFSAISDVTAPDGGRKLDMQESFVFAEVLKYIWLIHAEDNLPFHVQDSRSGTAKNEWVYNTEAHPFRVAGRPV